MKKKIVLACADLFNVHPRDLVGPARFAFLMPARFALYKGLNQRGWSTMAIGAFLHRDHSTILHGIRRATQMASECNSYATKIEILVNMQPHKPYILEAIDD